MEAAAPQLTHERAEVVAAGKNAAHLLERIARAPVESQQAYARRMADALILTAQAALLLCEAQWEIEHGLPTLKPHIATHFINTHLRPDHEPLDDTGYLPRLAALIGAV